MQSLALSYQANEKTHQHPDYPLSYYILLGQVTLKLVVPEFSLNNLTRVEAPGIFFLFHVIFLCLYITNFPVLCKLSCGDLEGYIEQCLKPLQEIMEAMNSRQNDESEIALETLKSN